MLTEPQNQARSSPDSCSTVVQSSKFYALRGVCTRFRGVAKYKYGIMVNQVVYALVVWLPLAANHHDAILTVL